MANDPLIDEAAIERLRQWGGAELVRQMVRLYLENVTVRLDQIETGLAGSDGIGQAAQGAHSLKSSAANVGASRVRELAAELEAAARGGDAALASDLFESLKPALSEAAAELSNLVEESVK
jgi:HPt (histidine-containing phosphotransfer) domain-containing protein